MKEILLKDGAKAIVDDDDFDWLSQFKWGHLKISSSDGYARRWGAVCGKKATAILMHRQIMGFPQGLEVDHVNHNTLDNRRSNLRVVTKHQNMANALKTKKPRSSKYKGVHWYKAYLKWTANIMRNGKLHHCGYFPTQEEAAAAYNSKALELSAEFSHINPIPA